MRIGLLGASRVAAFAMIQPAKQLADVAIVAVASRDRTRAHDYAALHGIPRVHDRYESLVADPDIDLVYIGTPPHAHCKQAMMAIEAGKPVLVEKPFSFDAGEASKVFAAASLAGVHVFEAMHSPHHSLFRRVLAIIAEGRLGKVMSVDAEFSVPIAASRGEFRWDAALGGGALMDLGVYPLAWCRRIAGEAFVVEQASADLRDGVDETFDAVLRFDTGVSARVRSSMVADQPVARLVIWGSVGDLEVINPLAPQLGHSLHLRISGALFTETVDGVSTFEAQLIAVRDTVMFGKAFPFPPDDFVQSMRAIDRVRAAFGGQFSALE